jgi:hypothetical protein
MLVPVFRLVNYCDAASALVLQIYWRNREPRLLIQKIAEPKDEKVGANPACILQHAILYTETGGGVESIICQRWTDKGQGAPIRHSRSSLPFLLRAELHAEFLDGFGKLPH